MKLQALCGSTLLASLALNAYLLSLVSRLEWKLTLLTTGRHSMSELGHPRYNMEDVVEISVQRHLSSSCTSFSSSSDDTAKSSSDESTGATHASSGQAGGHHGPHQHDALLYLFNSLILGAAVLQLTAKYPFLQLTVVLFCLGFICSVIISKAGLTDDMAVWGESWVMWMEIDPHLLLFTLLPALLAGDAMAIDMSVASRVGLQCLWLAGPGVIICAFSTAGFLKLYLGWDFMLCLCAGSILCATDPVAVVALLKELGASPVLTVQIQGESLLNDGTAVVLYLISYAMLQGEEYDWADIADFLVKKAMLAWALGLFIGYFFFSWIRAAANKLEHSSSMIQITLTFCCAYWSFCFVEGVLTLSGVLATVASSLVLARHMWPHVVSPDSMHQVWHTFESLGNIIIFFLAGAITGWIIGDINFIDYVHLIVIYIFLTLLRMGLIFASRPLLRLLSPDRSPVTWEEALVMSWGGLRGAVGLALAVSVKIERAPDKCTGELQIEKDHAQRLLFYVSGVAFLTMVVNATSAPFLVDKLSITAQPASRQKLIKMFHQQLVNWSEASEIPVEVTKSLRQMLHQAEEHIDHQKWRRMKTEHIVKSFKSALGGEATFYQTNQDLITELSDRAAHYWDLTMELYPEATDEVAVRYRMLGEDLLKEDHVLGKVDDMIALIKDQGVDIRMAKVVNQVFLTLVCSKYWKLMEDGDLRPGSPESEVLLTSIQISLSPYRADLVDYGYVHEKLVSSEHFTDDGVGGETFGDLDTETQKSFVEKESSLTKLIASIEFNIAIVILIILNSLQVIAEEIWRNNCKEECGSTCPEKDIDNHVIWLILDGTFTCAFFIEFVLKFKVMKMSYFHGAWNRFDFFLVIMGFTGFLASLTELGTLAGETRIIRIARVLRSLRFLRIFRILHAKLSKDKYVSEELARQMKKIGSLYCFARAHLLAQIDLIKYFGGNNKIDDLDEAEIARCILQSQCAVYQALSDAASTEKSVGKDTCKELALLRKRKAITETLSSFVLNAHKEGALSSTEVHAILHPLHHEVAACMQAMNDMAEGIVGKESSVARESRRTSRPSAQSIGQLHNVVVSDA